MLRHRQQRPVGHFIDLAHPLLNCFRPRLHAFEPVRTYVLDAIRDPIGVLLDGHRHVAQDRGLPGPVMVNRFGNPATWRPR